MDASLRWHDEVGERSLQPSVTVIPAKAGIQWTGSTLPMQPVVYMLCKHRHGALYTGVTSDLARRVWEHRTGAVEGFTRRYGLKVLVWYEPYETMEQANVGEKQIKAWKRDWKIKLIERMNPTWRDLYEDLNC